MAATLVSEALEEVISFTRPHVRGSMLERSHEVVIGRGAAKRQCSVARESRSRYPTHLLYALRGGHLSQFCGFRQDSVRGGLAFLSTIRQHVLRGRGSLSSRPTRRRASRCPDFLNRAHSEATVAQSLLLLTVSGVVGHFLLRSNHSRTSSRTAAAAATMPADVAARLSPLSRCPCGDFGVGRDALFTAGPGLPPSTHHLADTRSADRLAGRSCS